MLDSGGVAGLEAGEGTQAGCVQSRQGGHCREDPVGRTGWAARAKEGRAG